QRTLRANGGLPLDSVDFGGYIFVGFNKSPMIRSRVAAFFLIGFCQFSFGQLKQDEQQGEKPDDFGSVSALEGDPNSLWQGPTVPPATSVPCSSNCDSSTSQIKRADSQEQPGVSAKQASQYSQKPLPPAGELSDAAQSAASAGDWPSAIKAIN